jgi:hypothetical protein
MVLDVSSHDDETRRKSDEAHVLKIAQVCESKGRESNDSEHLMDAAKCFALLGWEPQAREMAGMALGVEEAFPPLRPSTPAQHAKRRAYADKASKFRLRLTAGKLTKKDKAYQKKAMGGFAPSGTPIKLTSKMRMESTDADQLGVDEALPTHTTSHVGGVTQYQFKGKGTPGVSPGRARMHKNLASKSVGKGKEAHTASALAWTTGKEQHHNLAGVAHNVVAHIQLPGSPRRKEHLKHADSHIHVQTKESVESLDEANPFAHLMNQPSVLSKTAIKATHNANNDATHRHAMSAHLAAYTAHSKLAKTAPVYSRGNHELLAQNHHDHAMWHRKQIGESIDEDLDEFNLSEFFVHYKKHFKGDNHPSTVGHVKKVGDVYHANVRSTTGSAMRRRGGSVGVTVNKRIGKFKTLPEAHKAMKDHFGPGVKALTKESLDESVDEAYGDFKPDKFYRADKMKASKLSKIAFRTKTPKAHKTAVRAHANAALGAPTEKLFYHHLKRQDHHSDMYKALSNPERHKNKLFLRHHSRESMDEGRDLRGPAERYGALARKWHKRAGKSKDPYWKAQHLKTAKRYRAKVTLANLQTRKHEFTDADQQVLDEGALGKWGIYGQPRTRKFHKDKAAFHRKMWKKLSKDETQGTRSDIHHMKYRFHKERRDSMRESIELIPVWTDEEEKVFMAKLQEAADPVRIESSRIGYERRRDKYRTLANAAEKLSTAAWGSVDFQKHKEAAAGHEQAHVAAQDLAQFLENIYGVGSPDTDRVRGWAKDHERKMMLHTREFAQGNKSERKSSTESLDEAEGGMVQSRNPGHGFHGTIGGRLHSRHAATAFHNVATHLAKTHGTKLRHAVRFLDSSRGRHLADALGDVSGLTSKNAHEHVPDSFHKGFKKFAAKASAKGRYGEGVEEQGVHHSEHYGWKLSHAAEKATKQARKTNLLAHHERALRLNTKASVHPSIQTNLQMHVEHTGAVKYHKKAILLAKAGRPGTGEGVAEIQGNKAYRYHATKARKWSQKARIRGKAGLGYKVALEQHKNAVHHHSAAAEYAPSHQRSIKHHELAGVHADIVKKHMPTYKHPYEGFDEAARPVFKGAGGLKGTPARGKPMRKSGFEKGYDLGKSHKGKGKGEFKFKRRHSSEFKHGYGVGHSEPQQKESVEQTWQQTLYEAGTSAGVKKGWEKRKGKEMTDAQVTLAAKHFTQSNLGGWGPSAGGKKPKNANDIERSYGAAFHAHAADGVDISDEFRSWVKDIRKGEPYVHKQIMKEIPFVHKHGGPDDLSAKKPLAPYYKKERGV